MVHTVAAQGFYKTLSPAMQQYLDQTGLGNDPAVLASMALAKAAWHKLTPVQAEDAIKRLMGTKEYLAGDKLTQIKIHLASRIANRESPVQPSAGVTMDAAAGKAHAQAVAAAKSELATLAGKRNRTPEDRARWAQLVAEATK